MAPVGPSNMPRSAVLFIALIFAALLQVISQKVVEDIPNGPIIKACTEKHPVEKDTIRKIFGHIEPPMDKTAKCFLGCAFERFGLIKNGTADWQRCGVAMKGFWPDKSDHEIIDKIVAQCDKEDDDDEIPDDICELASEMAGCKKTQGDKMGLQHLIFKPSSH